MPKDIITRLPKPVIALKILYAAGWHAYDSLVLTCKSISELLKNPTYWKQLLKLHFHVKAEHGIQPAVKFRHLYDNYYQLLDKSERRLFILAKEGSMKLKEDSLSIDKLTKIYDKFGFNLLNWLFRNKYQDLLDHFYQVFSTSDLSRENKGDTNSDKPYHWTPSRLAFFF